VIGVDIFVFVGAEFVVSNGVIDDMSVEVGVSLSV
jgi:hypothetical protein